MNEHREVSSGRFPTGLSADGGAVFRKIVQLGVLLVFSAFLCACDRTETQDGPPQLGSIPEADGYSPLELRKLHENHDPKTWDVVEDVDQLRFGLLRTSEIFATAAIARRGPVSQLETALQPKVGRFTAKTALGLYSLEDYLPQSPVDALIVVHKGKVAYERYPHMRFGDKHLYWSVANSFLGAIVSILEDEGRINVNDPIERYIDALSTTDWKGTPVIDILDMASGMSGREVDVPNAYTDPATLHYQFEQRLGNWAIGPRETGNAYDFVARLKRLKPSGQVYEYSSVNCFVIAWLIQEVTGKPYPEAISERIWQEIGADADAGIVVDRESGASWSHGGVFSTLRDLARYGMLFTPSWGVVSQEPVISAGQLRKIQTGGRPSLLESRNHEYPDKAAYSGEYVSTYQWDCVWPDGDFMKIGFQGQLLYISPGRDLVIGVFSSGDSELGGPFFRALATSGIFAE